MSDPIDGSLSYAIEWIKQQFTTLQNNFTRLNACCMQAGLNFTSIMSEANYPNSTEELVNELMLDAICSLPGLVFIKHLHALEEKGLVHQVALAAERIGKVMESAATVVGKSATASAGAADKTRTDALSKVMTAITADLDVRRNGVDARMKRVILLIMENRRLLPPDFKVQVLMRVARVDDISKYQAEQATLAYEERIFRFWAKQTVTVLKDTLVLTTYNQVLRTTYEMVGFKFDEKRLDYIKGKFGVTPENMPQKWGVRLTEHKTEQGYFSGY